MATRCANCGCELREGAVFCVQCGTQVEKKSEAPLLGGAQLSGSVLPSAAKNKAAENETADTVMEAVGAVEEGAAVIDNGAAEEKAADFIAETVGENAAAVNSEAAEEKVIGEIAPVAEAAVIAQTAVNENPAAVSRPVQQPVNQSRPVQQRPMNPGQPVQQRPMNPGQPVQQRPMNPGQPVQQRPMNPGQPVQQYPGNPGQPAQPYPMNQVRPMQPVPGQATQMPAYTQAPAANVFTMGRRTFEINPDLDYRPIKAWGDVGYSLLMLIPIVGFILQIVFACGGTKRAALRHYARFFLLQLLLAAIIIVGGAALVKYVFEVNIYRIPGIGRIIGDLFSVLPF